MYEIFLIGLFILGCGLTLLETAANPYATRLGDPEGATARLNLAQSFNGLAVFIAPVIGTIFILSGKEFTKDQMVAMPDVEKIAYLSSEADSVKMPYLILAAQQCITSGVGQNRKDQEKRGHQNERRLADQTSQ